MSFVEKQVCSGLEQIVSRGALAIVKPSKARQFNDGKGAPFWESLKWSALRLISMHEVC